MKFNWGTIALIIALIAIIVGGVLLNSNQEAADVPTPQPTEAVARLFDGLQGTRGVRLLVRNNLTGNETVLTRDPSFQWDVTAASGANVPTENRQTDQLSVPSLINSFATLSSTDSFVPEAPLESFGLTDPAFSIVMDTDDGGVYVMHIGDANVAGNRYFAAIESNPGSGADAPTAVPTLVVPTLDPAVTPTATVEPTLAPSATPSATSTPRPTDAPSPTPEPSATPIVQLAEVATIYLVPKDAVDALLDLIGEPPFVPLPPTNTPLPPTANPFSEVDQTATANAAMQSLIDSVTATSAANTSATAAAVTPTAGADISTPEVTPAPASATSVPATATSVPATATSVPPSATSAPATATRRASATPLATATP
jgi:hypothetical protein